MPLHPPLPKYLFEQTRSAARRHDHVYEAVIGIVVAHDDPKGLGRVQVKLPTLPSADEATHWAAVRALGAGADRGWYFLPEIDDEVVVMFEHGDIRRPVVIGSLWNGKDKAPETAVEKRVIQSRGGHRIELDDDGGTVTITDSSGAGSVVLSGDAVSIEAIDGDVSLQTAGGDLDLIANEINIKAGGNVTMHSKTGTTISGDTKVTLEGGSASVAGVVNLNGTVPPAQVPNASQEAVADPVDS